jgi:hypothetical protein
LISRFKRTQVYTSADFDLLKTLLGYFRGILVTPHILAEVNSLMGQMPDPHLGACRKEFLRCIDAADESHSPSSDAAHLECFAKFGLTDSTICQLSANHAVLTDDFPLAGFLAKRGADVINFNHLRSFFD